MLFRFNIHTDALLMKYLYLSIAFVLSVSCAQAQPSLDQIIKKIEAKFEPAEAKPGQTVVLKISLQLLDGWHTYPTFQPDKGAKSQTNKITFPEGGDVVFVGELEDPMGAKEKAEPLANIEKMLYYPGGANWERTAVVRPTVPAGAVRTKIKFRVLVCDKENCLPPKTLEVEATLKVAGDAMKVEPKYQKQVEQDGKK